MGGRVGLKGTDTAAIIASAIALGAKPESTIRATTCLKEIYSGLHASLDVICPPGIMGEKAAEEATRYLTKPQIEQKIRDTRKLMEKAAKDLDFIEAARFRDEIKNLKEQLA